ncbi:MAG: hypothetical protein KA232_08750 [Chryseobacterium sp.]|nr:hypothetical protein [Chryseobacterium sp.]
MKISSQGNWGRNNRKVKRIRKKACSHQNKLFVRLFPSSAPNLFAIANSSHKKGFPFL